MSTRKIIYLFLIISVQFSFAQRNLIFDERFENSIFEVSNTDNKGEWFSSNNSEGQSTIVGDEHQGTVAFFIASSKPNIFKSFIGQWINGVNKPGVYRVSFAARAMPVKSNQELNIYLRIKTDSTQYKFFPFADYSGDNVLPVATIKLTSTWEYYSVDFDLNKTFLTGTLQDGSRTILPTCESDLKDFFIGFSSDTENAQVRFTDVSMISISN